MQKLQANDIKIEGNGFVVDDTRYETKADLARAFGIKPSQFYWRLDAGWSLGEALGLVKKSHHQSQAIKIDGKQYSSHREAAAAFGIDEGVFNKRLSLGWSLEEAAGIRPHKRKREGNPQKIKFLGKGYDSKKELGKAFNLKPSVIMRRVQRGWSEREAVGLDDPPPRNRSKNGEEREHSWREIQTIDGKLYPKAAIGDYKVYAITNEVNGKVYVGITISDLAVRLRNHISEAKRDLTDTKLARAIRKYGKERFKIELIRNDAQNFAELEQQEIAEIQNQNSIKTGYNISPGGALNSAKPIVIDGNTFASRSSAAEYFGLLDSTFNLRLALGWSPEEAAGLTVRRHQQPIAVSIEQGSWTSLKAACKELGLKYGTVYARVSRGGWTFEQALDFEDPPNPEQYPIEITVKGVTYPSEASFCRAIGRHQSVVHDLKKTLSYEEIYEKYMGDE